MNIRLMTLKDYSAVYALWLGTAGMGLNPVDDSPQGIAAYLERNPASCFVAEENGEIVGAIMSGHDGRRGFIYHTAVAEAARGRGIGRKLTEHALAALKRQGIHKVALVAMSNNRIGNAFWERLGFTTREDLCYRNRSLDVSEPSEC